jgi:hypothetical protein
MSDDLPPPQPKDHPQTRPPLDLERMYYLVNAIQQKLAAERKQKYANTRK